MVKKTISLDDWQYWYSRVYAYFYRRVNSKYEVEELTSQTLNTIFLANNITNFPAYTWKVAHNYLVKYIKLKSLEPMPVAWDENLDLKNSSLPNWQIDLQIEQKISETYKQKIDKLLGCINNHLSDKLDQSILKRD
jgi:DNA-directed RNA polymerase specialized sigma24 family protein